MPGQWDDLMKLLIRLKPQHLVSWLLQEAIVQNRLSEEFKITMYADGLFLVTQDNLPFLVHIEFQSKSDTRMGERLRAYNTLASQEHDYLPVYSCVVYLRKNINVTTSPLTIKLPTGQEICRFHYGIIELSKLKAEELLQLGLMTVAKFIYLFYTISNFFSSFDVASIFESNRPEKGEWMLSFLRCDHCLPVSERSAQWTNRDQWRGPRPCSLQRVLTAKARAVGWGLAPLPLR